MTTLKRLFLLLACLTFLTHPAVAQDESVIDEAAIMEEVELSSELQEFLAEKIENFSQEIQNLFESVDGAQDSQLKAIKRYVSAHDLRWQSFLGSVQDLIASDDDLVSSVSVYQEIRQNTGAAIEAREKTLRQLADFVTSERVISQHVKQYEKLYKEAFSYSLIEQKSPDLEKLKAKDLLLMEDLAKNYELAHEAAKDNKMLTSRWEKLDNNYIHIKSYSQQIQQLEYKPLVQRAKDYVMSLAAVAIIILFFSFIVLRIKSISSMKKAAEEAKKLREQQNSNIPTI